MKNNKYQDVLKYVLDRYNINKPKTIKSKINDSSFEIILKDKKERMYFINIKDDNLVVQRLGDNYKDFYEINENDIFLAKRIYYENGITFKKIYPDELEYDIVKRGDVTFYEINERDYVINKMDENIYHLYEYDFKNTYLNCNILLNIPFNQYVKEEKIIILMLKNGNKIKTIEQLLSLIKYSIGNENQNIFINIKNSNIIKTNQDYLETYDGVVKINKTIVEEETIEYNPINYIKEDNKVKRR